MSERTQVKLVLTDDLDILNALRRNNTLRNHPEKGEYLHLQFNSEHFLFFKDRELVVPGSIAEGLYRSSGVLIGDAMSGTQQPSLKVVEKWELGEQEPSRKLSKTTCSVCGEEQKSMKALAAHIVANHSDEEEEEQTQGE
jgi:hypothetical protein